MLPGSNAKALYRTPQGNLFVPHDCGVCGEKWRPDNQDLGSRYGAPSPPGLNVFAGRKWYCTKCWQSLTDAERSGTVGGSGAPNPISSTPT